MARRAARFTQADIARTLRAVRDAGLVADVEIQPSGAIRIVRPQPLNIDPPADPMPDSPRKWGEG